MRLNIRSVKGGKFFVSTRPVRAPLKNQVSGDGLEAETAGITQRGLWDLYNKLSTDKTDVLDRRASELRGEEPDLDGTKRVKSGKVVKPKTATPDPFAKKPRKLEIPRAPTMRYDEKKYEKRARVVKDGPKTRDPAALGFEDVTERSHPDQLHPVQVMHEALVGLPGVSRTSGSKAFYRNPKEGHARSTESHLYKSSPIPLSERRRLINRFTKGGFLYDRSENGIHSFTKRFPGPKGSGAKLNRPRGHAYSVSDKPEAGNPDFRGMHVVFDMKRGKIRSTHYGNAVGPKAFSEFAPKASNSQPFLGVKPKKPKGKKKSKLKVIRKNKK